jgi:hypothetical protein
MISMSVLSRCYHPPPEAFLFHFNQTFLPSSFFVVTRRCRLYDDLSPVFEDHAGTSKSKATNQDDLSFSKKDNPRSDISASLERDDMDEARRCSSMKTIEFMESHDKSGSQHLQAQNWDQILGIPPPANAVRSHHFGTIMMIYSEHLVE